MKSQFSLLYDGQPFCGEIDTEGDGRNQWELAPDVFVTANVKRYPRYDAAEWVLSFDNNGEEPSKVISDIWDCDSFLPLDAPEWSKVLYLPEKTAFAW